MPYPLASFHEAMRTVLGDDGDSVEGYEYRDAQLDGALRTVVRMGKVPCLSLVAGENPDGLEDAPVNPDTWAYLMASAVLLMVGGVIDENVRTRAMSYRVDTAARREARMFIEDMVSRIEARGNVCGLATDTGHKGLFATSGDVFTYVKTCGGSAQLPDCPC